MIRSRRPHDPLGDVDEELRFHLERQVEELVASGWDPEAARAEARRRFGDPARVRETLEHMGRRRMMMTRRADRWGELSTDVSFALRQARRRPAFAAATVLVIALGVGVASAVFAVLDATWLKPLPLPDPERIVVLDDVQDQPGYPPSLPEFRDWEREADFLAAVATVGTNLVNVQLGDPERLTVGMTAGDVIGVTRLEPVLGRGFTDDERAQVDAARAHGRGPRRARSIAHDRRPRA
jgi:putative ABC transport system permease protein